MPCSPALALLLLIPTVPGTPPPAERTGGDRTIKKEPAYQTRTPKYALLVFGPEGKDRVWLVHDGAVLYVDRNGDGDLTGRDESVTAAPGGRPERGYSFEIPELSVGGRVHKGLRITSTPFASFVRVEGARDAATKEALAADPNAGAYDLQIELDWPGLHGEAAGGRVVQWVGTDLEGPLVFAVRPADAPVVHFGGPLRLALEAKSTLRLGRSTDVRLNVGTPGVGPGTFAALRFDAIPEAAVPVVHVRFPSNRGGDPLPRRRYELKGRC